MTDTDNSKDVRFDVTFTRPLTKLETIAAYQRMINFTRDQTWSHTRYRESQWIQALDLVTSPNEVDASKEGMVKVKIHFSEKLMRNEQVAIIDLAMAKVLSDKGLHGSNGITEEFEAAEMRQFADQFAQEEGAAKKGNYRIGVNGEPEIVTVEVTIPDPETTTPYKAMEASERAKDVAQGCSPILCDVRALDRRADLLRAELNELDKGVGDLYDAVSTSEEGGND